MVIISTISHTNYKAFTDAASLTCFFIILLFFHIAIWYSQVKSSGWVFLPAFCSDIQGAIVLERFYVTWFSSRKMGGKRKQCHMIMIIVTIIIPKNLLIYEVEHNKSNKIHYRLRFLSLLLLLDVCLWDARFFSFVAKKN